MEVYVRNLSHLIAVTIAAVSCQLKTLEIQQVSLNLSLHLSWLIQLKSSAILCLP